MIYSDARFKLKRMVFAFLTVLVTVHAYVFYSLYVVNGQTLMNITGEDSVLNAIRTQGGVYMFGTMCPIWAVVLVEFCFAYGLEVLVGTLFKVIFAKDIKTVQEMGKIE